MVVNRTSVGEGRVGGSPSVDLGDVVGLGPPMGRMGLGSGDAGVAAAARHTDTACPARRQWMY